MSKVSTGELRNKIASGRSGLLVRGSSAHSTREDLVQLIEADYSKFNGILDEEVVIFVISHPDVPLEWAEKVVAGKAKNINIKGLLNIREAAASNPSITVNILREIRLHENHYLDWAISANPNVDDSLIEEILESCETGNWSHSGGIIYTLAKNPTISDSSGRKLVEKVFAILDSGDSGEYEPSINSTIFYIYDDLDKKNWFTSEQESRVLLIVACS